MVWRARLRAGFGAELRTALTGIDPGLVRLRFAGTALASMALAVGVMSAVRAATGEPITIVLIAGVLAMVANLAVNEPTAARLRVTTVLMVLPATAAVAAGTVLAPQRVLADVVFVAVLVGAVLARRAGPRGTALGMAAVFGFFFPQFLQAPVSQVPWLLLAAVVGVGSTLLLRGVVLVEDPDRTVERMLRAFRAHVHGVVDETDAVLATTPGDLAAPRRLRAVESRRARMTATALLVAERLDRMSDDAPDITEPGPAADRVARLEQWLLDTELAAERLVDTSIRLVREPPGPTGDQRRALRAGTVALAAATATGTPSGRAEMLLDAARSSVAPLVAETDGLGDRIQRVAFAVARLADAFDPDPGTARPAPARPGSPDVAEPPDDRPEPRPAASAGPDPNTRQAVQVAVAATLAIVGGELVSPTRWYWAVLTAFVVFTGTTSRGDVLARGYERLLATVAGVAAGMALAIPLAGNEPAALALLLVCVFLALYLVRVSPALMAFWITAVLALLYGLIGQFSVETLLLRIAETAVGAVAGMLAGYLVLPVRTREAFGAALDELADAIDALLGATIAHLLGRPVPARGTVDLARDTDDALATLRDRARPLDSPLPWRRGRTASSYQRSVRVLGAVDHYLRRLARIADGVGHVPDPQWTGALAPAADRVRANLDGLRTLLRSGGRDGRVCSAQELVDAAETAAARLHDPRRRAELLTVARLLRRTDQVVVGFATGLGGVSTDQEPGPEPGQPRASLEA